MKRISFLLLGAALALSSCTPSVTVHTDYARGVNFRNFNTYSLEVEPGRNNDPVMGSDLNRRRISQALDGEMKSRGFVRATDEKPDMIVRFATDTQARQTTQNNSGFSPFMGMYGMGMGMSTRNYDENRILINVYDGRNNQQVWQGWASGQFYDTRKDVDAAVYKTVDKIMARFPVQDSPEYARQR